MVHVSRRGSESRYALCVIPDLIRDPGGVVW